MPGEAPVEAPRVRMPMGMGGGGYPGAEASGAEAPVSASEALRSATDFLDGLKTGGKAEAPAAAAPKAHKPISPGVSSAGIAAMDGAQVPQALKPQVSSETKQAPPPVITAPVAAVPAASAANALSVPAPEPETPTSPNQALDLHKSNYGALVAANVYFRKRQELTLAVGYNSEDDDSDDDEQEGKLHTERQYHDNGQLKFIKTTQYLPAQAHKEKGYLPGVDRLVEEKHYAPNGVCMMDTHFGLAQPYLSRKHYHPTQSLKSEKLFYVECERTMKSRKAGHWRTFHLNGCMESEVQYDTNGVRCSFCKKWAENGTLLWCKDYTKDYVERVTEINTNAGNALFGAEEAARLLGFPQGRLPKNAHEVNREYRRQAALLHPDKSDAPDAAMRFEEATRARNLLLNLFGTDDPKEKGEA